MTKNNLIPKGISYFLLVAMLYMHLCSAFCAMGSNGCCGKEDNDNDHCKDSCCKDEKSADGKKQDCQDLHFSFFNATGQFASEKSVDSVKPFSSLIAVVTPLVNILPVSQNEPNVAYNGFHPPPPKADIRIFIQSFQI